MAVSMDQVIYVGVQSLIKQTQWSVLFKTIITFWPFLQFHQNGWCSLKIRKYITAFVIFSFIDKSY